MSKADSNRRESQAECQENIVFDLNRINFSWPIERRFSWLAMFWLFFR
jgi:hypothetical protein